MTLKFEGNGLKFGRTWVDRIMGKVDKDQGVANAGKVLGIGSDGIVTPVEQTGGGSTTEPAFERIDITSATPTLYYNHNIHSDSSLRNTAVLIAIKPALYNPKVTVNSVDEANSVIHVSLSSGNSGTQRDAIFFNGYLTAYNTEQHRASVIAQGSYKALLETKVTIGSEQGWFSLHDLYPCNLNISSGLPFFNYEINEFTFCNIMRSSDRKIFKVVIDNFSSQGLSLSASVDVLYILAPPNTISTTPFENA